MYNVMFYVNLGTHKIGVGVDRFRKRFLGHSTQIPLVDQDAPRGCRVCVLLHQAFPVAVRIVDLRVRLVEDDKNEIDVSKVHGDDGPVPLAAASVPYADLRVVKDHAAAKLNPNGGLARLPLVVKDTSHQTGFPHVVVADQDASQYFYSGAHTFYL